MSLTGCLHTLSPDLTLITPKMLIYNEQVPPVQSTTEEDGRRLWFPRIAWLRAHVCVCVCVRMQEFGRRRRVSALAHFPEISLHINGSPPRGDRVAFQVRQSKQARVEGGHSGYYIIYVLCNVREYGNN